VRGKDVDLLQTFTEDRVDAVEQICLRDQRSAISGQLEKPLTLALSQRERGLNGGCWRDTPT
jgi:hypothetical protein